MRLRLVSPGMAAVLMAAAATAAGAQPTAQRQMQEIQDELAWVDLMIAAAESGGYYMVPTGNEGVVPVRREAMNMSIAIMVQTGTLPPQNIPIMARRAREMSDRAVRGLREDRAALDRRLAALRAQNPPTPARSFAPQDRPTPPRTMSGAGAPRTLLGEWSMNCSGLSWGGPAQAKLEGGRLTGSFAFGGSAVGRPSPLTAEVQGGRVTGQLGGELGAEVTGQITEAMTGAVTGQGELTARGQGAACTGAWRMEG